MATDRNDNLLEVAGLWLNEKNGRKFFRGKVGGLTLFVFRNERKKIDAHPDYRLLVAVSDGKDPLRVIDELAAALKVKVREATERRAGAEGTF
jgi:hypothetical protein